MKLIARKDFRNVAALRLKEDDGKGSLSTTVEAARHDDHIHKGAVFELGTGKDLEALRKTDRATAQIVAQLFVSGCVGDANDTKLVADVKADIANDEAREKNRKKLDEAAAMSHLGSQVAAALSKVAAAPSK